MPFGSIHHYSNPHRLSGLQNSFEPDVSRINDSKKSQFRMNDKSWHAAFKYNSWDGFQDRVFLNRKRIDKDLIWNFLSDPVEFHE